MNLASQASSAVAIEKPALEPKARAYRGPSDFGQRYGVQMKLAFIIVVTIEIDTAFFSLV